MALEKIVTPMDHGVPVEDKKFEEVVWNYVDDDELKGGFSIALVIEGTNWERAVRITNSDRLPGNNQADDPFYEVKAGDKSGTVASGDSRFKYDKTRVDYCKSNDYPLKLHFLEPFGPAWVVKFKIEIPKEKRVLLGGTTLYIYWSKNAEPRIFDDKANRIKKGKF